MLYNMYTRIPCLLSLSVAPLTPLGRQGCWAELPALSSSFPSTAYLTHRSAYIGSLEAQENLMTEQQQQTSVYIRQELWHNRMLFSDFLKKDCIIDICNVYELQGNDMNFKKPVLTGYILYDFIYMTFLRWQNYGEQVSGCLGSGTGMRGDGYKGY